MEWMVLGEQLVPAVLVGPEELEVLGVLEVLEGLQAVRKWDGPYSHCWMVPWQIPWKSLWQFPWKVLLKIQSKFRWKVLQVVQVQYIQIRMKQVD